MLLLASCATAPPAKQDNLCAVFDQYPEWYDDARASQERWGTPIQVQMAIVRIESAFHEDIRPPRKWFLGFIPLPRDSSAYGYAQIQDPAWDDYQKANGGWFKRRTDMEDALDFIGWYTDRIHQELGISKWDARRLYLAYHEGIAGYRSAAYRYDRQLLRTAARVERLARTYGAQLRRCESRFRCRHWYQFWPFCSA